MRRILLLITDLEIGGTPTVVRELAIRLRSQDVQVEVACLKGWGPVADQLREAGVTVTALGMRYALQLPSAVRRLRRLVRERSVDTVLSFLIHANVIASLAGRKLPGVTFLQSIQTTQSWPWWHWWLQRRAARGARNIVMPSISVAVVAHELADVVQTKAVIIPNAIDPDEFDIHGEPREKEIGFIGRLDPVKRIDDLVEAMALLPAEYRLQVFGEGVERRTIESQIARLDLRERITLHGAIARPQEALEKIGLLVLPSEAEGFGLVLIEAMAGGVPVVATRAFGIRDVVEDGRTGLLVPVRSPAALAEAISRVVEDKAMRDRLVTEGRAEVLRRFTWDVVLPQYRSLLQINQS